MPTSRGPVTMDMEDVQSTAAVTPSQKRPFDDDVPVSTPTKNVVVQSDIDGTPLTVVSSIATPSPLKKSSQASVPPSTNASNAQPTSSTSGAQPVKRRKLTDKEKEEKRLEKEAKDKAKAEQKAAKEEEKRKKEEERQKKNIEREEKKRAKELEQQQKEEEKRKKEEEKLKKERSQMKLNSFFNRPKGDSGCARTVTVEPNHTCTSETISLAPEPPMQNANTTASPQKAILRAAKTDYERFFLPFQLPSHAIMAPINRYMEDPEKLASARARLEQLISQEDVCMEPISVESFRGQFPRYAGRGPEMHSIKEIVERLNSSSTHPIDLTKDGDDTQDPLALLKRIPMKYLHFPEDVRPPYFGTYTRPHTRRETSKLAMNPFSRTIREFNYDYDSEAEWEEPEEGEDLDSDGEEDLDEDGDDDMDGFLDDEDDGPIKRRMISGDLQPVSTGLCWETPNGLSVLNDGSGAVSTEFRGFRIGFLLDPQPQSIDPFSTAYWAPDPVSLAKTAAVASKDGPGSGTMQPPRLPLATRPMNSMMNSLNSGNGVAAGAGAKAAKPPKRMIPADQLPAFKAEVEGSDLTKIALIEALKRKFPKLPKDAISNTLSTVAARVGPKEVDKRWVLL
ncbi:uncharacterized protein EI97DRAFT_398442 [Westerdykella ornata]|uniref:Chromatin assembly factor 1 subunit A n=1 Tax=Westerdykella ornata TaxID=318751 RepID=A0A6A6JJ98_WESOR|nr:uncharacterized protein EI97DRAFT_398442 [Westerdykella ornata]KAF2276557.1 hypothetical protein EI97DRAFT_398442 [Westerdykella ornata]